MCRAFFLSERGFGFKKLGKREYFIERHFMDGHFIDIKTIERTFQRKRNS